LFSGSIILFFTLVFFTVTASIVIGSAAVLFAASLAFAIAISTGVTIAAGVAILAYRMLVNVRTSGSVISGTRVGGAGLAHEQLADGTEHQASIDEVKQYFAAQPAFTGNGKHETLDAYVIKEEK
jgi:low affinity Fe/Cu permease